jgi:predicted aminopeptidase
MLGWRESRLVGTIFHEMAHERLYVPGDSAFSEAFAGVVEREGTRRWLLAHGRTDELGAYGVSRERGAQFATLLRDARDSLARLYASGLAEGPLRVEKERTFGRLKFEYSRLRAAWQGYAGYDAWFARPLNNAHLAAAATYDDCVPGLERELATAGSLPAFYARAEHLAQSSAAERRAAVCRETGDIPIFRRSDK